MTDHKRKIYDKKSVTRRPLHIALCYNLGWNRPFYNFFSFRATESYLYQNGVEFHQKVIGAGLNLIWGHLYYSGGIWTFPLLSATYASAPIAERAIWVIFTFWPRNTIKGKNSQNAYKNHIKFNFGFLIWSLSLLELIRFTGSELWRSCF